MNTPMTPTEGQILTGALFNEPMRVETVAETGHGSWTLGLVGTRSERFRKVSIGAAELAGLTVLDSGFRYDGDGALLRLGLQAHALGIAWEFDPYFGLSVSRVDPLPHQLEAVYDHLLKLARVRFLLADDAGAGKTPRARAVGFLMALYQRRLASSTRAMRRSLANRADRLERGLAQAEDLARMAPPDLPSIDELDEMEERDRERLERLLDAITLAGNAEMVRQEIAELRELAVKARNVEDAGVEAKLARFEDLLRGQGFFDRPD